MNRSLTDSLRPWLVAGFVVLFALTFRLLWPVLTPLSLALLLTYILVPLVDRLQVGTGLPRGVVSGLVYLCLIWLIALVPARLTTFVVNQVQTLTPTLNRATVELGNSLANLGTPTIFGQPINPYELYTRFSSDVLGQLVQVGTRVAGSSFSVVAGVATTFLSTILWLLFILVISFYIVTDSPNIARYFWSLVPREMRGEAYYLTRRLSLVWSAFLRGQLLLSTVIFVVTTLALMVLGVPQALFLGMLAGVLNLLPNIGPILSSVPSIALALVQGSTRFDLSPVVFALLVAATYTVIQQLEAQLLVPRIIGGSVKLHPAVVMLGAIAALSTFGILGIFLAAPAMASLRVLAGYAYRKLLDPAYHPPVVELPPAIAAIPDPRERDLGSLPGHPILPPEAEAPPEVAEAPPLPTALALDHARIQAILFDLDGTLMQLRGGPKGGAVARWLRPLAPVLPGRDPAATARRFFVVTETPTNYALAVMDRTGLMSRLHPLADRARRAKGIGTLGDLHPFAGVPELLEELAACFPLGVLTSRARRETNGFLDANGLRGHFRAITTRQDLWRFKPHPEAVRRTARLLGVDPTATLMVGDMPVDMIAAKRAGAQALGVLTGFATEEELRAAGADEVVTSVTELPRVLGPLQARSP